MFEKIGFTNPKYAAAAIERSVIEKGCYKNKCSRDDLPSKISKLITGADFWRTAKENRYKKLIRDGYGAILDQLADMAATKSNPAHWFAKAASKAMWEQTLATLETIGQAAQEVARVVTKIKGVSVKFVWWAKRQGLNIERWSDLAAETGISKPRLFNWYCQQELAKR